METPPRQLDIFADSGEVMLGNDLADAIVAADIDAARRAMAVLTAEFPDNPSLVPAARLIAQLADERLAADATADASLVLQQRTVLELQIVPAAAALLTGRAPAWLAQRWRPLARRARALPWRAEQAGAHAASLFIAAEAWAEAAEAAATIDSWRRIPQPLLWMAEARWHLHGADTAWPLLAEALWLAPARAAALIPRLGDAALARLTKRFEQSFDPADDDWAWLPAWAIVEQPLLAGVLAAAEPQAGSVAADAFVLVAALLRLERQGQHHEIVEHRKRLRGLSPHLFAVYMATR